MYLRYVHTCINSLLLLLTRDNNYMLESVHKPANRLLFTSPIQPLSSGGQCSCGSSSRGAAKVETRPVVTFQLRSISRTEALTMLPTQNWMHGQSCHGLWWQLNTRCEMFIYYMSQLRKTYYYLHIISRVWITGLGFTCSEGKHSKTLNLQAQTVQWLWYLPWDLLTLEQTKK